MIGKFISRRRLLSTAGSMVIAAAATVFNSAALSQGLVADGEQIADQALLEAAKEEGMLLYYTVNLEENERELLAEFKEATGVDFEVIRLNGSRMYERVITEYGGGQLQADLVSLSDFVLMQDLIDKGVLAAHRVPGWDEIPDDLKQPEALYYVQNRYAKAFGYNTAVLSEEQAPKSWMDLLDPELKGLIGIQQASSGGIGWTTILMQRQIISDDYWEKLAANEPRLYTGLTQASEDVARGELAVSEMLPIQGVRLMESGAPMALTFPEEGIPASAVLVGVTSVAEHPNAAKLYLNWVLSKHGGEAITRIFFDWATHPDVAPPSLEEYGLTLPPASQLWVADRKDWVELQEEYLKEWEQIFQTGG